MQTIDRTLCSFTWRATSIEGVHHDHGVMFDNATHEDINFHITLYY